MWIQDYRNQAPYINTFEINAETKASLAKSFEEFALLLAQTSKEKEDFLFIRTIEQIEKRRKSYIILCSKMSKNAKKMGSHI